MLVLFIGLGAHSSKNALAPAAPLLEAEGMSALLYSMIAASPQLGAIVAPVLWGMAYTWSERLVQVLVPLGDFLGQLVLVAGLELWAANAAPHLTEMVLACGLVIFSIARAGVGVVQHAAMARLLLGQRLLLGFVVMIFFGHVVVAICNWTVPRVLDRSGLIGLQITLLLPNAVSVFAASCLACCWGREPVPRSPMRTLSPSPSTLSFPLLDEDDPEAEIEQEIAQKSPGRVWALPCTMSASYDCCGNCGHEKLQSEKAIWLLGTWRGLLLGVLHAFQSFTNDLLVSTGRNHKEAGSVVAVNQMIALLLMPLVAFSGYFIGLRVMLVVISLLPFFGTLALLAAPSLLLEAGLLAIATAATVMPVLPLVLVPANSRSCGKSFGLLDSLYGLGQATVTVAIGALREEGGFEAALPFLAAAFASAALLSVWVAHVVRV